MLPPFFVCQESCIILLKGSEPMDAKEILSAVKSGKDYDFIANNYYNMEREELATVYKELAYSIYSFLSEDEYKRFLQHYTVTLEERLSED